MGQKLYKNAVDFFGMFEADTFDEERKSYGYWRGYVKNESGELVLAADYIYDWAHGLQDDGPGLGWWDDMLI